MGIRHSKLEVTTKRDIAIEVYERLNRNGKTVQLNDVNSIIELLRLELFSDFYQGTTRVIAGLGKFFTRISKPKKFHHYHTGETLMSKGGKKILKFSLVRELRALILKHGDLDATYADEHNKDLES